MHQFNYNLSTGTNGSRDKFVLLKNGKVIIIGNEKNPCMLLNTVSLYSSEQLKLLFKFTKAAHQLKRAEKCIVSAVKQSVNSLT